MRIAFVLQGFPVLSESFIISQITGLLDRHHDVDIYAAKRGDTRTTHGEVQRYRLLERAHFPKPVPETLPLRIIVASGLLARNIFREPRALLRSLNVRKFGWRAKSLTLLFSAAPYCGRKPYDVVHCHFGPNGLYALSIRELGLLEGKLVTTFHGYDASREVRTRGSSVYRDLFERGDLMMAVSRRIRDTLLRLGCPEEKIIVHRVGVNCEKFPFRIRTRPGGPTRISTVARMTEKKGIEYGIRAVARLTAAGRQVRYRIVGDGALRESLARLVAELGVEDRVTLLGALTHEQVVSLLDQTDIFLLPSVTSSDGDEEGVPTSLMEAMAMGIPVVSTLHSGIPELVEDGVSGLLAAERDVPGLTERLAFLIDHTERWETIGRRARAQVEQNFNIETLNDQLVRTYQCLVDGRSPAEALR